MRHFAPAEVSSSPSADSLFKVQSAFLTKQKSRHIWKSCQLLCHGDPYPRLARYTSFHIYRLWAQSPVLRPSRPAAKTEGSTGGRRLQRWSRGGWCIGENAPVFLFIQFSRSSYTNRITCKKIRVNRQKSLFAELLKPKSTKFRHISLNVTKRTFRS